MCLHLNIYPNVKKKYIFLLLGSDDFLMVRGQNILHAGKILFIFVSCPHNGPFPF